MLPDFHGNRSPLADPRALGVISGLPLDASFDALCRLYWRTCVAIALGLRHILEHLNDHGYAIDTLHVTGGHTRNPLLMELYADATRCRTVEPAAPDAVLLGTAMVAAAGCAPPPLPRRRRRRHAPGRRGPRARPGRRGALRARLAGVPGDAAASGRVRSQQPIANWTRLLSSLLLPRDSR